MKRLVPDVRSSYVLSYGVREFPAFRGVGCLQGLCNLVSAVSVVWYRCDYRGLGRKVGWVGGPVSRLPTERRRTLGAHRGLLRTKGRIFLRGNFRGTAVSRIVGGTGANCNATCICFGGGSRLFVALVRSLVGRFCRITRVPFGPRTGRRTCRGVGGRIELFLQLTLSRQSVVGIMGRTVNISPRVRRG